MAQFPDLAPQMFRPHTVGPGAYLIAPEGLLLKELVIGTGVTSMDILDPLQGHLAVFAKDDILRVRASGYLQSDQQRDSATAFAHEFWAVGAVPSTTLIDVWLRVTATDDLGTHFRYAVERLAPISADQYTFMANTLVIGYGPVDNRLVQLRATRERTPQIDIFTTGAAPWDSAETQVRIGRLDDLGAVEGDQYGIAAGSSLQAEKSAHTRVSDQGVHLSQLDLTLDNGSHPTVQLENTGALKLGSDLETEATTGVQYDPEHDALTVRASLQARGPITGHDELSLHDGDVTTIAMTSSGEIKVGADVSDNDNVDLAYDPPSRTVHIRNAQVDEARSNRINVRDNLISQGDAQLNNVEVNGDLSSQGDIILVDGDMPTTRLGSGGLAIGSDLRQADGLLFDLQSGAGTLAIAAVTTLQGDVTFTGNATLQGDIVSNGPLRFQTGDVVKAQIDHTGEVKLGPDINAADGIDLHYDPDKRSVEIRDAQLADVGVIDIEVHGSLTGHGDITLSMADVQTVRLGGNGNVQFGTDFSQPGGLLFDLQADAGTLAITATTTLQGSVVFQDSTLFQAAADFRNDVTVDGRLALRGVTTAHNTIELLDNGALVVGEAESIRVDRNGIAMRLEPGEHNAVKVLGIGRAAMLNAYQTAQGVQQFDMLAYYSAGVPSLNGRLMMGVANVSGGDPDLYIRMTRYFSGVRRIDIQASLLDIESDNIQLTGQTNINGNFEFSGTASAARTFRLRNLPTKPDGLLTGTVWNNHGTLNIVQ